MYSTLENLDNKGLDNRGSTVPRKTFKALNQLDKEIIGGFFGGFCDYFLV